MTASLRGNVGFSLSREFMKLLEDEFLLTLHMLMELLEVLDSLLDRIVDIIVRATGWGDER